MKRINPQTLVGPRAYFTDFDHRIVMRSGNLEVLRKRIERRLKVLLLVKSKVVCAASHLTTRFAYEFFKAYPILLTNEAIMPALREDKESIEALFDEKSDEKRFPGRKNAISFFKNYVQCTVTWNLKDNSTWFRDRFIADLEDDKSVVRRNLGEQYQDVVENLLSDIRKEPILARDVIDRASKRLPIKFRRLLLAYRELLYHVSGARVVNCESTLPQENYIDYDLADIRQKRTRLTEEQIFWKFVVELVFDSLQRTLLPVEVLDTLTFEDVMNIRRPILESEFQEKYDRLIKSVVEAQNPDNFRVLDIQELENIRTGLDKTFSEVLEKELRNFIRKKAIQQSKQLASVSSSLMLNLLGAIPQLSLFATMVGTIKDAPAILSNISQTYSSLAAINDTKKYYESKEAILRKLIDNYEISNKSPLYDMVALLTEVIAQRMRF